MKNTLYLHENRSVVVLAAIFSFRMLGLFMILPVFSMSVTQISGATPGLIGLALGVYGLTQAICQIPLGIMSDRIGRRPIIAFGLFLFFVGGSIAAYSSSIWGIVLGRAIQGSGAIGSVILALLADITRIENRTRSMAIIGMSIGFSFILALLLGPILYQFIGLSGLFWIVAWLGLVGILLLYLGVNEKKEVLHHTLTPLKKAHMVKQVFLQPELLRLNLGIFIQHAILTASFIVIPKILSNDINLPLNEHWKVYLPVFSFALIGGFPLIFLAEKYRFVKAITLISIFILIVTQMSLALFSYPFIFVTTVLSIFFLAFTLLEAFLPSLISKIAPIQSKGAAMGIYSTAQFLGIFLGGSTGGIVLAYFGITGVFWFCGILAILWLLVAYRMSPPPYLVTRIFNVGKLTLKEPHLFCQQFLSVEGVAEATFIPGEDAVYLKINSNQLNESALKGILAEHMKQK